MSRLSSSDLVARLRTVPEHQLAILGLAWKLLKKDGALDLKAALKKGVNIEGAIQEAEAYSKRNWRTTCSLLRMGGQQGGPFGP